MQEKKQKQARQKSHKTEMFYSIGLMILGIIVFLWIEYLCPDARYVRDNLNYVLQRMEEAGVVHPPFPSLWTPLPVNMNHLLSVTESWTSGYLQAAAEYEDLNAILLAQNPYDTLSRLFLYGNMSDVQALYNNIAYCSAICSPDMLLTSDILTQWSQNKTTYYAALQGCAAQAKLMGVLLLWIVFWFAIAIQIMIKRHRVVSKS